MTDEQAVIEYRDEDTGTVFRWHGGAYIDVGYETPKKDIDAPPPASVFRAQDVINVWNYGGHHDRPDISDLELAAQEAPRPFAHILELFEETCRGYLAEAAEDEDAIEEAERELAGGDTMGIDEAMREDDDA